MMRIAPIAILLLGACIEVPPLPGHHISEIDGQTHVCFEGTDVCDPCPGSDFCPDGVAPNDVDADGGPVVDSDIGPASEVSDADTGADAAVPDADALPDADADALPDADADALPDADADALPDADADADDADADALPDDDAADADDADADALPDADADAPPDADVDADALPDADADALPDADADALPDADADALPDADADALPDADADADAQPAAVVQIPGGFFYQGCNTTMDSACESDEYSQHPVTVPAFAMLRREVTAAEYKQCVVSGVCTVPSESAGQYGTYDPPTKQNHPINFVSWFQAVDYCSWYATQTGDAWGLCTESQWELAVRGTCDMICPIGDNACCQAMMPLYAWGNTSPSCDLAVYEDLSGIGCGTDSTWPVGSKLDGDSPYGVQDMAGNISEWIADCYKSNYSGVPLDGSAYPGPGGTCSSQARALRGGSFKVTPEFLRASNRGANYEYVTDAGIGFRCCYWAP